LDGGCSGPPIFHEPPKDGDGDHHHRGYGWGWGYGHGYGGYGAPVMIEGVPAPVAVTVPVAVPAAAPVAEAPCNCLTKQSMPDGSVLFQDICTKASWVARPQTFGAR
jgi:hypothetical protein